MGLEPDVACRPDPQGYKAWLDDDPAHGSLVHDECLRLAVQQLEAPVQNLPAAAGISQVAFDHAPADAWRERVASIQSHAK